MGVGGVHDKWEGFMLSGSGAHRVGEVHVEWEVRVGLT